MLQPKKVKHRKQHRGRMRGRAKGGTEVHFGDFPGALFLAVAVLDGDDDSVIDEQVADLDGRGQQSAGVEPQIDNQSAHAVLDQLADDFLHLPKGPFDPGDGTGHGKQ